MADGSEGRGKRTLRLVPGEAGATGAPTPAVGAASRDDGPLVRAFLEGDDAAFGELVRRHERTVLAVVRRFASGSSAEDVARDLAQQAFLRAFQAARRSFRRRDAVPFRAWLLRIAVNLGRNHLRHERRWRRAPEEDALAVSVPASGSAALERAERERAVRDAMLRLSRRQRDVLTLRIDAELSFREVAEALGITENAAKVHFHHAARRLRDALGGGEPL